MANGYVSEADKYGVTPLGAQASNSAYKNAQELYSAVGDYSGYSTGTRSGAEQRLDTARSSGNNGGYAAQADASYMSDRDWKIIQDLNSKFSAAQAAGDTATMNSLHEQAEKIRAGYGYSGGADGSQFIGNKDPNKTTASTGKKSTGTLGTWAGYGADPGDGTTATAAAVSTAYTTPEYTAPQFTAPQLDTTAPDVSPTGRYHADTASLKNTLEQWKQTAIQQQNGAIDYNVARAVDALERALQDAQPQFQEQAASVARDERQGMDNSALYAQLRGDNGGIGQAQYNEVQAQAARNRLNVQQAQTKLSTDTARQIEDLRAQGEFEKADAALQISQQYLQQLMDLERWAQEYNLSADQFEASLNQWSANYQASMAQFNVNTQTAYDQLNAGLQSSYDQLNANMKLGYDQLNSGLDLDWAKLDQNQRQFDANLQYNYASLAQNQNQFESNLGYNYAQLAQNQNQFNSSRDYDYASLAQNQKQFDASLANTNSTNLNKQLASMGQAMLSAGIMPNTEQLTAMGLSSNQASQYLLQQQLQQAAKSSTSAGKSGGSSYSSGSGASSAGSSGSSAYRSLYNEITHINPGTGVNVAGVYADKIANAINAGNITGNEADKLIGMLGY